MIEALMQWDHELFVSWYQPAGGRLESIMVLLSAKLPWIPLYLLIVQQIILKYGRNAWLPLLLTVLVVVAADQVTSSLMKPFFARLRPCHDPMLDYLDFTRRCGGKFGFASSHAANTMGLAVMVCWLFRRRWPVYLVIWALLVSYSRIFLGVHFPLDVISGMGIGAIIATIAMLVFRVSIRALAPAVPVAD